MVMQCSVKGFFLQDCEGTESLLCNSPHRLTFTWWGCYGLCLRHKPTKLARSFCSVLLSVSVFIYGPFKYFSLHEFSRQLSAFSFCSSGLSFYALSLISTICLFMKVSLSPDIIPVSYTHLTLPTRRTV